MRLSRRNAARFFAEPGHYARLFHKRLGVRILSAMGRTDSPHLEFAYFILTWRCNLHCEMCPQRGQAGIFRDRPAVTAAAEEIDVRSWKRIADKIRPYRPTVQLFGGEPLLYKGALEIIRHVKGVGLRCQVVTNGTLLRGMAEGIVESGLDDIWLSLDGPAAVHNELRGSPRAFQRAIEGLTAVVEARGKRNRQVPRINVLFTITNRNHGLLTEFLDALAGLDIATVLFSHVIFVGRRQYEAHERLMKTRFGADCREWRGYIIDKGALDVETLLAQMEAVRRRRLPHVYFHPEMSNEMIRKYYSDESFSLDKRCYAPWLTAQFHPDGSLAVCSDFTVGNVLDATFEEIWNSSRGREFRAFLNRGKLPLCDRCCMIHRHSLFRE